MVPVVDTTKQEEIKEEVKEEKPEEKQEENKIEIKIENQEEKPEEIKEEKQEEKKEEIKPEEKQEEEKEEKPEENKIEIVTEQKEDKKGIPLDDIEENKEADDNKQLIINEKKEELLSSRQEFLITFGCYCYVLAMAVGFDKIIILDSFNGSTVANYINIIAPCMFYLYFSRGKRNCGEKTLASFDVLFGSCLVIFYFIFLFY